LIDPNKISLGGGVSGAGDYLLDALNKAIKKQLFLKDYDTAEIVISTLGNDAGIIGAALLAKDYHK
jgi:glucokinase